MTKRKAKPKSTSGPRAGEVAAVDFARKINRQPRSLYALRFEGCPHRLAGGRVYYPMPAALDWFNANVRPYRKKAGGTAPADDAPDSLRDADRRAKLAEAQRREIEVAKLRGELVSTADVAAEFEDVFQRLRGIILRDARLRDVADELLTELHRQAPEEVTT